MKGPLYIAYAARALGKTTGELTDEEFHQIITGELDEWIETANTARLRRADRERRDAGRPLSRSLGAAEITEKEN